MFSEEDKVLIKVLRQERIMDWSEVVHQRVYKNWSLLSVKKLLTKIDQTGNVDRKLTTSNKFARFFHAKQLLKKYPECSHNSIHMVLDDNFFYFCSAKEPSER